MAIAITENESRWRVIPVMSKEKKRGWRGGGGYTE